MTYDEVSGSPLVDAREPFSIPTLDDDLLLPLLLDPLSTSEPISSIVSKYPSRSVCLSKVSAVKGGDVSVTVVLAHFAQGAFLAGGSISSTGARRGLFFGFDKASIWCLEDMLADSRRARTGGLMGLKDGLEVRRKSNGWLDKPWASICARSIKRSGAPNARTPGGQKI